MNKVEAKTGWSVVQKARESNRFRALHIITEIIDEFIEFHGDRLYSDDASFVCGIGLLDSLPVTIIAEQKGTNTKENLERNFGMPHPEGYRKALRLMKQAEKFNRPIITFIDTPGAYCGIGAEERGQGESIARNLMEMSSLKVPIIAIVVSEGGSGGALAISVSDEIWMFENSVYSILSPEGFASILWKDSSRASEAANMMKLTAGDLKKLGIIEKIIKEDKEEKLIFKHLKKNLIEKMEELKEKKTSVLLEERYKKYRSIGELIE